MRLGSLRTGVPAGRLGIDPASVTYPHQVHGSKVVVADGPWSGMTRGRTAWSPGSRAWRWPC